VALTWNANDIPSPELWIGLVELRPRDKKAFGAAGAYTNIVTWARNAEEFRSKVDIIAKNMDFFVIGIEEEEPLAARLSTSEMTEEVEDMVRRAEANPNAIVYGAFHTYPFDEA
jgi:hypothetical protein